MQTFFSGCIFLQTISWGAQQVLSEVIYIQLIPFSVKHLYFLYLRAPVAQRIPWEQRLHFRCMSWRAKRQLISQKRSLCLNGTQRMDGATHRINHCPVGLWSLTTHVTDGSEITSPSVYCRFITPVNQYKPRPVACPWKRINLLSVRCFAKFSRWGQIGLLLIT